MRGKLVTALPVLAALANCSMAPDYAPPTIAAPPAFKEVAGWTAAQPGDGAPRGKWWEAFGDPVLDDLEARAEAASPTLAAALARYDQALAVARIERSDLTPTVTAGADASRRRVSGSRFSGNGNAVTYDDLSVGGSLDYELDLWGRIRNSLKAARADAQASDADLASARLSLQASVADAYVRLRGLDAQAVLLRQSADAFARAHDLTATRHRGGIASGLDVNRAQTTLSNARAEISAIASRRAVTEHEIAALIGAVASDFTLQPTDKDLASPDMPIGTPSELLQRRPDIAAAERRMFAANARIGVARAAYFPSLTLGLNGGWEATRGELIRTPNLFWGLGPLSALGVLFDGGRRNAQVKLSRADYEESAGAYRATVLGAFRDVEDAIAESHYLKTQTVDRREAADAATRTSTIAFSRYHDGASGYLEVVTAQTDALDAQRSLILVQTAQLQNSIALVRAMGGAPGSLSGD